jgi:hypothetical protein
MSGGDNVLAVKDSASAKPAAADDRLRSEAFERTKKDAIALTQNGGINLSPDTYANLTRGQHPWEQRPGVPPAPIDIKFPPPNHGPNHGPDHRDHPRPPGDLLRTNPTIETAATKIGREALVIGGGVGESFFYGIANLPSHLPQIGSSIMIGGTLSAITKAGKLGTECAMVIGAYFTTRFILDTINDKKRWDRFGTAVKDTWHSGDNFRKNMTEVRDTFGNYVFDTTLSTASSYVGYNNPQLGELLLGVLRIPPIVPNTPPPFSPHLMAATRAMSVMPPSGFYTRYEDQRPWGTSAWDFDFHGSFGKKQGYEPRTPGLDPQGDLRDRDRNRDKDKDQNPSFENDRDRYRQGEFDRYREDDRSKRK